MQDEFAKDIPEKAFVYLEKMQSAAVRMSSMIDGVLNYSIANTSEQEFESINLNTIIGDKT